MSLHAEVSVVAERARIALSGRLDGDALQVFKSAWEGQLHVPQVLAIEVDLAGVEGLDSAALAMLMLLRERAALARKPVILTNSRGGVRELLETANLRKLFAMH